MTGQRLSVVAGLEDHHTATVHHAVLGLDKTDPCPGALPAACPPGELIEDLTDFEEGRRRRRMSDSQTAARRIETDVPRGRRQPRAHRARRLPVCEEAHL